MRRLMVVCAVLWMCLASAGTAYGQAADEPRVLVFSKTAAFRHGSIPAGVQAIRELGTANAVRRRRDRGRGRVHRREPRPLRRGHLALDHRRRARRAAAGGVRALHPGRRWLRRRARRERHRVHVELVRRPRRRVLQRPPGSADRDGGSRRPRAPLDQAPSGPLDALGRVVQLPIQPAREGPRPRHAGRDDVHRRRDGHRPPDRLVQLLPGRSLLVHGRRPRRRVLHRSAVPPAPARRHPVGRRRAGQRLRRHGQQQLPEGRARRQRREPDGAGHRARRPRDLHRARRPGARDRPGHLHHEDGDDASRSTTRRRTACSASRWTRTSPPTAGSTSTTRRRRARSRHRAST